jgi:UDP-N-acetylglucosamine 2-epimerase (non-hydrolysing)
MSQLKVMTVVGTRPEIIRLSRTMQVLDDVCEHVTVHTGQNYDYELNGVFYKDLGLRKPDHFLEAAGANAAETIGQVIARVDGVLEKERPEALLVLGDTNSCLSVIPAKRRRIPVFHMEAGNRCFDMRVPEEINRRIVDHVADINLTYSEHSRRYLLAEGMRGDRVIKTGSPMKEVLDFHRAGIEASDIHARLGLEPGRYFTVSIHREENVDDAAHLSSLVGALNALAERYGHPLVFSVHPRTRRRLEAAGAVLDPRVRAMPPLGFLDYNALQRQAFCAVSDSGTITEESSILGFPAITVREAHERPEGMDEGVVVMSGLSPERILQSVEMTRHQFDHFGPARLPEDYNVPNVSWKVAKIILGYTDYVRRVVWMAEPGSHA